MIRVTKKRFPVATFVGLIIVISIILVIIFGIKEASKSVVANARVELEQSLRNIVVHCYAIEGQYPPNLDYIEKNFGFSYDHKRFFIKYQSSGDNILPDIFIGDKLTDTGVEDTNNQ